MITGKQIAEILIVAINVAGEDSAKAESVIESQPGGAEMLDTPILELIGRLTPRDIFRIDKGIEHDAPAA